MNAPQDERRRELDLLQARIATRASITHLAHGAVATMFSLMIFGMAALFEWGKDNIYDVAPYSVPVALAASALMLFALLRFWLGWRAHLREVVLFAELQSLRRELKLEDPSMLLPP